MNMRAVANPAAGGQPGSFTTLTATGALTAATGTIRTAGAAEGTLLFAVDNASQGMLVFSVVGSGVSTAASGMWIAKNSGTDRSINAAGTVNASGADYAEYMRKAAGCGNVAKGQIVGIDANGHVTDKWVDSVTFMVKTTNPSYVGGDVWGSPEALGLALPVKPEDPGDEAALQAYANACAVFDATRESARQQFDRIAFAGQVPCNVTGATPGQYIVPAKDGSGIKGIAKSSPTLAEYMNAVGKVIAVEPDGRARIIVKAA